MQSELNHKKSSIGGSIPYQHGNNLRRFIAIVAFAFACIVATASTRAQNAYITNAGDNTVSVINTATNR
ncbi:MAG TPA: hypothetical protein VEK34_16530 [Methylocella sp.]|nr:hypothetical protein [Methylocella sp.]